MENALNSLVESFVNLNLTGIDSQYTISNANTLLTNSNQELSHNWVTCSESNPNDRGYVAWYCLMIADGKPLNPDKYPKPSQARIDEEFHSSSFTIPTSMTMETWVDTFLGNNGYSLNRLSQTFMTQVYSVFESNPPASKSQAASYLATINNINSLLQAQAQADMQPGQNGITLLNNLAQHFGSGQGPLSSATQSIFEAWNNYSSSAATIVA